MPWSASQDLHSFNQHQTLLSLSVYTWGRVENSPSSGGLYSSNANFKMRPRRMEPLVWKCKFLLLDPSLVMVLRGGLRFVCVSRLIVLGEGSVVHTYLYLDLFSSSRWWRQRGHSKIEDDDKKDDFQSVVGSFVCSLVTNLPLRMRAEGKKDKNIGGKKDDLDICL